jgi:alanine racemase
MPLALSNAGQVLIAGRRCPIRGRISMDSMAVGLAGCPDAEVGADVLVYGRRGDANMALEEIAHDIGSIPYELMVRVGSRVQRIFTRH